MFGKKPQNGFQDGWGQSPGGSRQSSGGIHPIDFFLAVWIGLGALFFLTFFTSLAGNTIDQCGFARQLNPTGLLGGPCEDPERTFPDSAK